MTLSDKNFPHDGTKGGNGFRKILHSFWLISLNSNSWTSSDQMNKTTNYTELKSLAITKRTEFLNSEQYGTSLIQLFVQLLNLMENNSPLSEYHFYKPNIELFSLYQDYLTLNEAKYQASDVSMLKRSFEYSLYASIEPNLLEIEIH